MTNNQGEIEVNDEPIEKCQTYLGVNSVSLGEDIPCNAHCSVSCVGQWTDGECSVIFYTLINLASNHKTLIIFLHHFNSTHTQQPKLL